MTPQQNRTLERTIAVIQQQCREYLTCRANGDYAGALRAAINILNGASFINQEAIDEEAAHARSEQ